MNSLLYRCLIFVIFVCMYIHYGVFRIDSSIHTQRERERERELDIIQMRSVALLREISVKTFFFWECMYVCSVLCLVESTPTRPPPFCFLMTIPIIFLCTRGPPAGDVRDDSDLRLRWAEVRELDREVLGFLLKRGGLRCRRSIIGD